MHKIYCKNEYLDGELNTKDNIALLHVVNDSCLEVGEGGSFVEEHLEALQETGLSIDLLLCANGILMNIFI